MLHLLDEALERFLRAELGQAAAGLDISFALPDKDWAAGLNRPTLDLCLCSVNPASQDSVAGLERFVEDGHGRRRPALPRMAFTYLVTAWVADVRDEHRLLGAVLAALARPRTLDEPHLPVALRPVQPRPTLRLDTNAPDPADLWPAIGGRFHPALALLVAASVDPGVAEATAEPPAEIALSVADRRDGRRREDRRHHLGAGRQPGPAGGEGR
jgi:hypothetical protein